MKNKSRIRKHQTKQKLSESVITIWRKQQKQRTS